MSYEIEIKALLGSEKRAKEIRKNLKQIDVRSQKPISVNTQLNHYFEGGDIKKLYRTVSAFLSKKAQKTLKTISEKISDYSVRTRDKDGNVFLVVKASVDNTTSANGISRMEFEEKVPLSLSKLDGLVRQSGFSYQAKWSRKREEYVCRGVNITLDKNAGYGWLSEFERIVNSKSKIKKATKEVRSLMRTLKVEELPQDRLGRMFDYYNRNWRKYYGTNKIFRVN